MTKRDYEKLAAFLKEMREHALGYGKSFSPADFAIRACSALATVLEEDNPRFDRNKFLVAALPQEPDFSGNFGSRAAVEVPS